jgi:glutamate formiminotransferase
MQLVQCVPNLSEGRNSEVVASLLTAVRGASGVTVVDHSTDPDHNRMVITFLGATDAVAAAAIKLAECAVARIDLNRHTGRHPRIGALDVLPFVPFGDTSMEQCIALARQVGRQLADQLGLPVFYYEEAATRPERRSLPWIRNPGFEALRARPLAGDRAPDEGPDAVHPTAGAVVVGARGPLLAYNINLQTDDVRIARAIAQRIRERDGGLVGVRALGLRLDSRKQAQVSINITRPATTPLHRVFELVRLEAGRYGVAVSGSEVIGAMRMEELLEAARFYLGLHDLRPEQVLDLWAAQARAEGSQAAPSTESGSG